MSAIRAAKCLDATTSRHVSSHHVADLAGNIHRRKLNARATPPLRGRCRVRYAHGMNADRWVWQVVRDARGQVTGTRRVWLDVGTPHPRQPRLFTTQPVALDGMQVAPWCTFCGAPMVWRGTWQCIGCTKRGGWELRPDGGLWHCPLALPREALAGAPIFSSQKGNNSTGRSDWLASVELLTSFHRRKVAARLRRRGARATEYVDQHGEVTHGDPYLSAWHEQRVKGQAERFDRVRECGAYEYALECTAESGEVTTRPLEKKCDCWRVCPRCLNRRKWKLSKGMEHSRARALSVYARQSRKGYRGPEGKWSEKLFTFTVPHGDTPAVDARLLVDAWQKLLRRVRRHLVERGATVVRGPRKVAAVSVPWCRALEVAPGGTGGHAHLHVWWHGPFIDVVLLRAWWGQLLADGGRVSPQRPFGQVRAQGRDSRLADWLGNPSDDTLIPWPVVDIRAGNESSAAYTQKVGIALYTQKGTDLNILSPAHAAAIYEVFEGTRAVQWARGWAPPKKPLVAKAIRFRRLTEDEKKALNDAALSAREKAWQAKKSCAPVAENQTGGLQSSNGTAEPDIPPHSSGASGAGQTPLSREKRQLSLTQLGWMPIKSSAKVAE